MNSITTFAATAFAAAGIALTPAPAAADGDDIAKIIAGLAVAGIVAKAIDDRKDRKRARREAEQRVQNFGRFGDGDGIRHDNRRIIDGKIRRHDRDDGRARFGPGYKRVALPDRCLVTVETARGDRLAYGARCLNRNFRHAGKLPSGCETVVRTRRGFRTVYGARCLERDGWQVLARR
ncbi:MAG: hypothetical protein HKN98_16445 [Silicimonas sp.]|nr:hypothetical protein [Silicimonas sp.]